MSPAKLFEMVNQLLARAVQRAFHRANRHAGNFDDFVVLELLLVPCDRFLDQLTVCSSHQPRSLSTFASNWIYGIGLRSVAKLGFMVNFAGLTLWPETPPSHAAAYPGS